MSIRKRYNPGDQVSEFTAQDYARLAGEVEKLVRPPVVPPLVYSNDAIQLSLPEGFYAKLTGTTSPYSMAAQSGSPGGAWAAHVRTCTNCAYEVNGVTGLNNKYAWLEPGYPGDYRFQWVANGAGTPGGSGGTGTIPFCFCTAIPATLTMKSCNHTVNYAMFQDCTIQWQATPAVFAPLNLGPNMFLSTASFVDPITQAEATRTGVGSGAFYYHLTCQYNQFSLTRLYPSFPPTGGASRDGILYIWLVGGPGNNCGTGPDAVATLPSTYGACAGLPNPYFGSSGFYLCTGQSFPGSDVGTAVGIYAGSNPGIRGLSFKGNGITCTGGVIDPPLC